MENQTPNFDVDKLDVSRKTLVNSLVNASLSLLPGGSFVVEGFNYYAKVKQERLTLFLEEMKKFFEGCSENEIDEEFLKSEDFAWLFETVIKKVVDTKSKNKQEMFRKILINSIGAKKVSNFSETFLSITSQLHEKQIEILEEFKELYSKLTKLNVEIYDLNQEHNAYKEAWDKAPSDGAFMNMQSINGEIEKKRQISADLISVTQHEFFGLEKKEHEFYLQDLVSKCLMQDTRGHGVSSSDSINHVVTEFGTEYLNFLKA